VSDHHDPQIATLLDQLPVEPSPASFWQQLRVRAESQSVEVDSRPPVRRRRPRTLVAALVAACVVSLAAGTALGATLHTGTKTKTETKTNPAAKSATIAFAPTDGWNTVSSSIETGLQRQQMTWATNEAIAPNDPTTGWPTNTLKTLKADQVVIWAALNTTVDTPSTYPPRDLPLTLGEGEFKSNDYGGQPAPNVSEIGPINAKIDGKFVTAYLWFGSNHPTPATLQAAQLQLSRLQLP
jgi:hypothetical protein